MKKILIIIFGFFLITQPAWAATQSIKISPVSFDLTMIPGQKLENVVKVSNPSTARIGVTAATYDFKAQGEDGGVEIVENYQYGLGKYVSVFPRSFSLEPGELQYVTVTIDLPAGVPAGARSGVVTFGSSSLAVNGSGSVISGQVGALFTVNVLGNLKDQGKIESFSSPVVSATGPIDLVARVRNTGQTLAKFTGKITVKNILGARVYEVSVGPNNILPEAVRRFGGAYGEPNPFGIYQAELNGTLGSEKIVKTVYFVGASPVLGGPVIFLALLLAALLYRRKKGA